MPSTRVLAVALALACGALPLAATAQWQWVEKDGRKVFSDKAPPPDIPAKNIVRQPGMRAPLAGPDAVSATASATPAPAPSAANVPKLAGKESELENRRKQALAAESDKKKAQENEDKTAQADSCRRSRESKAAFESGVRVARTNDRGEREILDDSARAVELQRVQAVITRDCRTDQ